jgi:ribose 5-phosphate isomerase B
MDNKIDIVFGSDHGGLNLKKKLMNHLEENYPKLQISDLGTYDETSIDYPDYAKKVVDSILSKEANLGILVCGTGIGMSIKANRYKGIRAALAHNEFTAQMAKEHNNANILCLGERATDSDMAIKILDIWLTTEFAGDRHQRRINKLDQ